MRASHLEDFYSFLRFPSVSTDENYSEKLTECAHWLVEKLNSIGLKAELVPTPGHPVVWARNQHREGRRAVLIYGHYDVQPPDPLELWDSPPFEPVLKDGFVFARGATDNKGQILSHILGVQETIEQRRELPVNLHFIIEGEEEIGSGSLGNFIHQNRDALKCDIVVVSDTGMIAPRTPTLSYGLRGVAALELKVTGPKMDLHSGIFGGAVANPATALARAEIERLDWTFNGPDAAFRARVGLGDSSSIIVMDIRVCASSMRGGRGGWLGMYFTDLLSSFVDRR